MGRVIALCILLIPIIGAGYGIKLMRDAFFFIQQPPYPAIWVQFLAGLLFFALGMWFLAGFIFHRDKKRGKVTRSFTRKKA
ncbi:DUF2627 domain-containing protein [Shouchella clausii]|uniref:DUF2627 domain-containing protein n=3 Tax=Shouchella TaxID=2893057 RepID=Q5WF70_SHOC1|nr:MULTISPECIES: DUF2627 domain-containing protein [Shouchella]MCM3313183.1 DUF2627 domain-containing protein [Psychrobacillus sp. MER TA 17]ALA54642.1 hypothetical protein DB29_03814 [Shouchella clausii]KKI87562.1 membrane protein [Shouchella clausii]MBU3230629.1 DUF2627 domain-containing protein [Shouchella clausii]MBU3263296.1 DUF2627 domain-containing protein [Shouchella clausii]